MSQIEIDIIVSKLGIIVDGGLFISDDLLEVHQSGNIHLKLKALPATKGKKSHIIFLNNKFVGNANIIENYEVNNCVEVASIEELPF